MPVMKVSGFGKILLGWKTTLKITQQTFNRSRFHGNKTKFIYLAIGTTSWI